MTYLKNNFSYLSKCQNRCDSIFQKIVTLSSAPAVALDLFDEITATICEFTNVAHLVVASHPDPQYQLSAEEALRSIYSAMGRLYLLHKPQAAARLIADSQDFCTIFNDEQKRYALKIVTKDNSVQSSSESLKISALYARISTLESQFYLNLYSDSSTAPPEKYLAPYNLIRRLPYSDQLRCFPVDTRLGLLARYFPRKLTDLFCDLKSLWLVPSSVFQLPFIDASLGRELKYRFDHTKNANNIPVIQNLVGARQEFANAIFHESFAHFKLEANMAKSPSKVFTFLTNLHASLQPRLQIELKRLTALKHVIEPSAIYPSLQAWDIDYYATLSKIKYCNLDQAGLMEYFSLENCLKGLGIVSQKCFGCNLIEVSTIKDSDTQRDTVKSMKLRKFELVDQETNDVVGYIYMDLFDRPLKRFTTFTIRASHQNYDSTTREFIKPSVFLMGAVTPPTSQLSHDEVQLLFHEFGHCLQILFSQTRFQSTSNGAGPVDFIELPAVLMENFAWEPRCLKLFARHSKTGEPIPDTMLDALVESRYHNGALEAEKSLLMAMFVLLLASPSSMLSEACIDPALRTTPIELFNAVTQRYGSCEPMPGTHYPTQSRSIINYPAAHYSYLWCQVLADDVWRTHFIADPLSHVAGRAFRGQLLQAGDSVKPQELLEKYLGHVLHDMRHPSLSFL